MKQSIVVTGARRSRQSLLALLTGVAIVLTVPLAYELVRNASQRLVPDDRSASQPLRIENERLARDLRESRARVEQLNQELADVTRGRDIDREAAKQVQTSLAEEQQEAASLREQLAFYRGVVSPQALQSGLHVNALRVSRNAQSGTYRFDLVLVQSARQQSRASGRIEIRFIGRDDSARRSLSLDDVVSGPRSPLLFSFRHFQEFEGEFQLPAGFRVQRIVVALLPDHGGDSPHVEEEFEWSKVQDAAMSADTR